MVLKNDTTIVFNLSRSIGSNSRVPTLFPEEYEVWDLNLEDYLQGLEEGYAIWTSVIRGPYSFPYDGVNTTNFLLEQDQFQIKHKQMINTKVFTKNLDSHKENQGLHKAAGLAFVKKRCSQTPVTRVYILSL